MERKPTILPFVCGVPKRNWYPFICGGCKKNLWYTLPRVWHYRDLALYMEHGIKCPHCGEVHKRKVLILDVNDEYESFPEIPIINENDLKKFTDKNE